MTAATASPIHGVSAYAAAPATESIRKISSGAYATEDKRIGGEHRQGDPLGQQRVTQPVAAKRPADEQPARSG